MKLAYCIDYSDYIVLSDFIVHHGIKGQKWGVRNGPPYPLKNHLGVVDNDAKESHTNHKNSENDVVAETIFKSIGGKARNYNIWNPITGENMCFAEGTNITQPKDHIIAGKGKDRKIDCEDWLNDKYEDAIPGEWTKEKGFGYVDDEYGDRYKVEVHWYQNPAIGKVEFKIKETPGGEWYVEEL